MLRKSFLIFALLAECCFASTQGLTSVPILSEFGVKLGANLSDYSVVQELEKDPWSTSRSYIIDVEGVHPFTINVGTTLTGKIYWISASKKVEDCKAEFPVFKADLEAKYEVALPDRDLKILSKPNEQVYRKISGYCSGNELHVRATDVHIKKMVNSQNSQSYKDFKDSLPVCVNGYLRPISWGWMTSAYGERTDPFSGKLAWHDEIDFGGKLNQFVYASDSGVVLSTSFDEKGYGNRVEIRHSNGDITTYSQLNSFLVVAGDSVKKGQPIARLGSTGRSTGPHVGFGLKRSGKFIDPKPHMVVKDTCRPVYLEHN
jgi:murein DD-endopeptidase MepM/ murein hydrolase activator NlpD